MKKADRIALRRRRRAFNRYRRVDRVVERAVHRLTTGKSLDNSHGAIMRQAFPHLFK